MPWDIASTELQVCGQKSESMVDQEKIGHIFDLMKSSK